MHNRLFLRTFLLSSPVARALLLVSVPIVVVPVVVVVVVVVIVVVVPCLPVVAVVLLGRAPARGDGRKEMDVG